MLRATFSILVLILTICPGAFSLENDSVEPFDLVIYGATASGITAAVAASDRGLRVALVEAGEHFGGMVTSGLSASDVCVTRTIGGMTRSFFEKIGKHYGKEIRWRFEPHVARKLFGEMLDRSGVSLFYNNPLKEIVRTGTQIQELVTTSGKRFQGKIFIDASYEGDLMAKAGVSYTFGREGSEQYGEVLAGARRGGPDHHQWSEKIPVVDQSKGLLPGVRDKSVPAPGTGDREIPAYNFRVVVTDNPDNQIPFAKPREYDPGQYELLARYLSKKPDAAITDVFTTLRISNTKVDLNNRGPFSTDYIGESRDYPEGDAARREEIWQKHAIYTKGLLYFVSTDPRVPASIRDTMKQWGYAKDEFVESENWPPQLYVREARRMLGEFVMTQVDVRKKRRKPDSVGMGSCPIESHHVQRVRDKDGFAVNEGYVHAGVRPYQIPYRSILPKKSECTNLIVPVSVSASHVAYSSLRMEPVYMILGESAGIAAALAVKDGSAVQDVSINKLQHALTAKGQVLKIKG